MAFKQAFYKGAQEAKAIDKDIPDDAIRVFTTFDAEVANILTTTLDKDYYLQAVDATEIFKRIGTSPLDVWGLLLELGKIMPSIFNDPTATTKSKCLNFMELILFEVGPATRQVKAKQDPDRHWKIRNYETLTADRIKELSDNAVTMYNAQCDTKKAINASNKADHTIWKGIDAMANHWKNCHADADGLFHVSGTVVVATFKSSIAPTAAPSVSQFGGLQLTVKQASLCALHVLNAYSKVAEDLKLVVLTPLAGAIFARTAVANLMADPEVKRVFKTESALVSAINTSAQSGGQHLTHGRADIAAVCCYVATEGLSDRKLAKAITQKTVRQFIAAGRPWSKAVLEKFAEEATGGIPADLSFDALSREIPRIHADKAARAAVASLQIQTKASGSKN